MKHHRGTRRRLPNRTVVQAEPAVPSDSRGSFLCTRMCWRKLSCRLKSLPQFLYGHLCAAEGDRCVSALTQYTRRRAEITSVRTLFIRVDAANVTLQMLASLETLIASGNLAFVPSNILLRSEVRQCPVSLRMLMASHIPSRRHSETRRQRKSGRDVLCSSSSD